MSCICPFCGYSSRSDNVKRHIQLCHKIETCLNVLSPSGCTFKPAPRKPYVAVSLASEGNPQSVGYCFRCGDIIPHITGASMAMYSSHACKPARGGKGLPPIPDTSFLNPEVPEASETPPSLTPLTDSEYWADVLERLKAIPGVVDRMELKKKRIKLVMGDAVEVEIVCPKELIVEMITGTEIVKNMEWVVKQAKDAEEDNQRLTTANSMLETDLRTLHKKYDSLSHAYNTEIAAARAEIERLKRQISPPPTMEIIEHSN